MANIPCKDCVTANPKLEHDKNPIGAEFNTCPSCGRQWSVGGGYNAGSEVTDYYPKKESSAKKDAPKSTVVKEPEPKAEEVKKK